MKHSRNAPSGATPHPDEGPAPRVAGASSSEPTRAAAPLEPPGSTPSSFSPRVDWADPTHVRAWLGALRAAGDDLSALAREGTRRLRYRVLSRAEIRRQARAATRSLHGRLAEAEAALVPRTG